MPHLTSRRASAGFSLVEIMVGIVVGLFVLVGLSSVYVNSVRGGRTTTASNQLNQELRALMDIMVNDIRRAGYWSLTAPGVNNAFDAATTAPRIEAGCILYSYDNTARLPPLTPGVPGPEDRFGFRLDGAGVVQTVAPETLASTATACADATWQPLTDAVSTEVTRLTFHTIGSECLAFVSATYVATDPTTFEQWETTSGAGPACVAGAPGAPAPFPDATHHFVETRQVNIALTGRSRTDPGLPPLTIEETVLIRANRVILPAAP